MGSGRQSGEAGGRCASGCTWSHGGHAGFPNELWECCGTHGCFVPCHPMQVAIDFKTLFYLLLRKTAVREFPVSVVA